MNPTKMRGWTRVLWSISDTVVLLINDSNIIWYGNRVVKQYEEIYTNSISKTWSPYKTNEMKDKPRDYLCLDVEFMKWSHDTDFSPHGQKTRARCVYWPCHLLIWYCGLTINVRLSMNDVRTISITYRYFNHACTI